MRRLTFGRGPGADVILPDDPYMSPIHCAITEDSGKYYVADLGSTNGTHIIRAGWPDLKVPWLAKRIELLPGDKVRIGRTILPYEVPK